MWEHESVLIKTMLKYSRLRKIISQRGLLQHLVGKTLADYIPQKTALPSTAIHQAQRGDMIPPQLGVPFFMSTRV